MSDVEHPKPGRKMLMIIGAVAGAVLAYMIGEGATKLVGDYQNSPARISSQVDNFVAGDPTYGKLYAALEKEYPDEYAKFKQRIVELAAQKVAPAVARQEGHKFMREFAVRHAQDLRNAPRPQLFALRDANQRLVTALAGESTELCGRFTIAGFGPTDRPSAETTRMIAETSTLQVRAMGAGRRHPVWRDAPGEADVLALRDQLIALGMTADEVQALFDGSAATRLAAQRQCDLGVALYRSLVALPADKSERLSAALLGYSQ